MVLCSLIEFPDRSRVMDTNSRRARKRRDCIRSKKAAVPRSAESGRQIKSKRKQRMDGRGVRGTGRGEGEGEKKQKGRG